MADFLLPALGPGVALTGVLFALGVAAATAGGRIPHLGLGALAPAGAFAATRIPAVGRGGAVAVAVLAGAVFGLAGYVVDLRARDRRVFDAPLLPDIAVLGLAMALAVFVRPVVMVEVPLGALGGIATTTQGVAAGIVGLAGGVVLLRRSACGPDAVLWVVAGSVGSVAVLFGSGALSLLTSSATPVFTLADTAGLAIRAAAVGVAARHGAAWAGAAAALAAAGETLARTQGLTAIAWLPTVVLLAIGAFAARRRTLAQPA